MNKHLTLYHDANDKKVFVAKLKNKKKTPKRQGEILSEFRASSRAARRCDKANCCMEIESWKRSKEMRKSVILCLVLIHHMTLIDEAETMFQREKICYL